MNFELDFSNRWCVLPRLVWEFKIISIFQTYVDNKKDFKPYLYSLKNWLNKPNAKIITDIKNDNLSGLKFISKNFENFEKIFIPQIYRPVNIK